VVTTCSPEDAMMVGSNTRLRCVDLHEIVKLAVAPLAVMVAQLRGLFENDPRKEPNHGRSGGSSALQVRSSPFTVEGFVPPPKRVMPGPKWTVPFRLQVIAPGATPIGTAG
jgi:hypothetical protein